MEIALIPQSAPFNAEQRAWLNGFLAGWIGINPSGTGAAAAPAIGDVSRVAESPAELEPWHDPALELADRLKLAENEPLPKKLMSAMAQLDCGACGYLCKTYSEAIADGSESRLTLCSPGGSETSKTIKKLLKESANGAAAKVESPNGAPKPSVKGWSRENPYTAKLIRSVKLNGEGSEKETRHIEIDLGQDGPTYEVGDSLAIYPRNCSELVSDILKVLGAAPEYMVKVSSGAAVTLHEALADHCCLSEVGEVLLEQLAASAADPVEAAEIRGLLEDDGPIAGFDVLDVLLRYPSARPHAAEFVALLSARKPRLYSISSSPRRHSGQVHLTVRRVTYQHNGRERKGVASTMLADRVGPGSPIQVYVQKSHGFTLPADPTTPVIMVGPGTGIAPFRAFLHERDATAAKGPNWLFFGDQRSNHDFLYEEELSDFVRRGVLTRLDTAFSRDQEKKVYVQDRILEQGEELFRWLQKKAHFYVCGDAKRMAADVDRALREVVRREGAMSEGAAKEYISALTSSGRYRRDVY